MAARQHALASTWQLQHSIAGYSTAQHGAAWHETAQQRVSTQQMGHSVQPIIAHEVQNTSAWAAQYKILLLIKLTPKGIVFSFLSLFFLFSFCKTHLDAACRAGGSLPVRLWLLFHLGGGHTFQDDIKQRLRHIISFFNHACHNLQQE